MSRRQALKVSAGSAAALGAAQVFFDAEALAEDKPNPGRKRFCLYIHMGSSCGIATGLVQPPKAGEWPKGFFRRGSNEGAANPLLNQHTQAGSLVFHDYLKFMPNIADQMCLVSGTPQSLSHAQARALQITGGKEFGYSSTWPMAVAQNQRTDAYRNPLVVTGHEKANTVLDVTGISAGSVDQFKSITQDSTAISQTHMDPLWAVLKNRFERKSLGSVELDEGLGSNAEFQLETLTKGLKVLNDADKDIRDLTAALSPTQVNQLVAGCAEKTEIARAANATLRNRLILAGVLAKHGIASGMSFTAAREDRHQGGADVFTARVAAGTWALVNLFWQWIKKEGLADDTLVIVGQEFARSPYNNNFQDVQIMNSQGRAETVRCPGRDHGLFHGLAFLNGKVPSQGRVGMIIDNLTPVGTTNAKGKVDASILGYTSENIVGSMLMRVYPELFPTERIVRKFWPSFREIGPILT